MSTQIKGISSMATRQVLADLVANFQRQTGQSVHIESVGGVDAAKRVQAGEAFDVVILASDAIDKLIASGQVLPGRVDLVHSGVAVAVRAGAAQPDISSEDAVRAAVLAARSVSYSTGPSGVALAKLFERWGIAEQIKAVIRAGERTEIDMGSDVLQSRPQERVAVCGVAIVAHQRAAVALRVVVLACRKPVVEQDHRAALQPPPQFAQSQRPHRAPAGGARVALHMAQ